MRPANTRQTAHTSQQHKGVSHVLSVFTDTPELVACKCIYTGQHEGCKSALMERLSAFNFRLMSHMHEHVSNMSLPGGPSEGQRPTCPQCFRCYLSPFQLQRHIEAVHQPADQPAGVCLSVSDVVLWCCVIHACVWLFT